MDVKMRTWDAIKIGQAFNLLDKTGKIDPIDWLSNPDNIVLENDLGDLALFEYAFPDKKLIYSGHYFFKSRGRQAITAATKFLDELFNSCYNVNVLMGAIPVHNKAARWLTRQVGFTSDGVQDIHGNDYEIFFLTKVEFNNG